MGAPRHTPERRAEAMAALYASCELVEEELVPNFRAVEKRISIDQNALMRWWKGRDRSLDGPQRAAAVSRAAAAAVRGAESWGASISDGLHLVRQRALELLNDEDRFKRAKYDEASRGLKGLGETLKIVDSTLKDLHEKATPTQEATDLDAVVRAAMEKDLPQGAGSPQGES